MKRCFAALAVALGLAGCGSGERGEAHRPAGPVPIAADVYMPYVAASYPKSYAKWGAHRMTGDIQNLRERAAEAVASRVECDAVMLSELSDRSAPPSPPEVFVDCENGNRWRYSLSQQIVPRSPDQMNVYGN